CSSDLCQGNHAGSFVAEGTSFTVLRFAVGSLTAVGGFLGIGVFALLRIFAPRDGVIARFCWHIAGRSLGRTGLAVTELKVGDRLADLFRLLQVLVPVRPDSGRAHKKERSEEHTSELQ